MKPSWNEIHFRGGTRTRCEENLGSEGFFATTPFGSLESAPVCKELALKEAVELE